MGVVGRGGGLEWAARMLWVGIANRNGLRGDGMGDWWWESSAGGWVVSG